MTIRSYFFGALAILPFAAMPAMAQTNTPPTDQNATGTPGGTATTESGKTVQTPPTPPGGNKGGESGGSGSK